MRCGAACWCWRCAACCAACCPPRRAWKYLLAGLLFLGVLNTYLYLGNFSFWTFIQTTVGNLVRPLRWLPLRWGRIDLVPLLALGLVWFVFTYLEFGLNRLFARLPL